MSSDEESKELKGNKCNPPDHDDDSHINASPSDDDTASETHPNPRQAKHVAEDLAKRKKELNGIFKNNLDCLRKDPHLWRAKENRYLREFFNFVECNRNLYPVVPGDSCYKSTAAAVAAAAAAHGGNNTRPSGGSEAVNVSKNAEMRLMQYDIAVLRQEVRELQRVTGTEFEQQPKQTRKNGRLSELTVNFPLADMRPRGAEAEGSAAEIAEDTADVGEDTDRQPNGNAEIDTPAPLSMLSKCPRDLYMLWEEWMNGIGGRKAARLFNIRERSQTKGTFGVRKHLWQLIKRLMEERGVDHNVAIDQIYEVYGKIAVTRIIKAVRHDAKRGGHPNLK